MLTLNALADLASRHRADLALQVREFDLAGRAFAFNSRPAVMGVINLSPDSWYRESVCTSADRAIRRGRTLAAQGADLVDLGAESTLAHAARAADSLQTSRLLPVIRGLRDAGVLVSVETYSPDVTRACLQAGANVLNLTGTTDLGEHLRMVADHGAGLILCHVQGDNVRAVQDFDLDGDVVGRMCDEFARRLEVATRLGITRIFLDPGLGFYYRNLQDSTARVRHQMRTFLETFRLRRLGFPVCNALPHAFEQFGEEVRSAEPFFAVLAALGGTDLYRTHEVPRIRAVLDTLGTW